MARTPQQKTIDNPRMLGGMDTLYNNIVPYEVPRIVDGTMWRYVVAKQPIIGICITSMVMYAQSLPWDVRAKQAKDKDKLADKVQYYKDRFTEAGDTGRLNHLDLLIQDYYTVPFGGASEKLDYSDGRLYKMINIDAGTLFPTNNISYPVMQKVGTREPVLYKSGEIVRMFQAPRPEIQRAGWGITPAEKVYLAVELLNRGDKYYAQLLLDTPEAGILDLGDMSKDSAEKWLDSYKSLLSGIDGFKIPVLYQHTVPAKFIPFGRPPTEILFNDTTFKYASIVCAAFGITVGDIGLKHTGGGASLSGQMRDERHSKSTGYASLKAHLVEYYNKFLPDGLEFVFIDTDDELLVAKGRARSANSVGLRNLVEAGIITPDESRAQLVADGLITIPIPDKPKDSEFDILKEINGMNDQIDIQQQQVDLQKDQLAVAAAAPKVPGKPGAAKKGGQGGTGLNKQRNLRGGKLENVQGKDNVPASQGGNGEIKSEASDKSKLESLLVKSFDQVKANMTNPRKRKLIKTALKKSYTTLKSSASREDYDQWNQEYMQMIFDNGDNPVIKSFISEQLESLSRNSDNDRWWEVSFDTVALSEILQDFYILGLEDSANEIQAALYEEGLATLPNINKSFDLKNEASLKEIDNYASDLAFIINHGTGNFINRLSLASVLEASDDPYYHEKLKEGMSLEDLLSSDNFVDFASNIFETNLNKVLDSRIKSISGTEDVRLYNKGVLKQYSTTGITTKTLVHLGDDEPCETCVEMQALGYVPLDFKYKSKFGGEFEVPPFHPHCDHVLTFNKNDLKGVKPEYFTGE